jgi:hypothetical protein
MDQGFGRIYLQTRPHLDWLDTVIRWLDHRRLGHRYLVWHCANLARCRFLWWIVLPCVAPFAVAALVWYVSGYETGPLRFLSWGWRGFH